MTHIMVDLETLGVRPGAVILSIGAIAFDPVSGWLGDTFYQNVSLESCESVGLTTDQSTIDWWKRQKPEAWAALQDDPISIQQSLARFFDWFDNVGGVQLWSHGPNFDEVLLSCAARAVGQRAPWKYSEVRCTRTVYDLAGVEPDRSVGTHHNALDDARNQAVAVLAAYRKLGLGA